MSITIQQRIRNSISSQSSDTRVINAEAEYLEQTRKLELKRREDENNARRYLSEAIFTLTVVWMFFILLIIVACGLGNLKLSDTVLVALITTTTANVFGFMYVVVKYLFNESYSS